MECPVCKNRIGFVCGTCIDCGFDQISNEFKWIKVNTKVLKAILSENEDLYYRLLEEHEHYKRR